MRLSPVFPALLALLLGTVHAGAQTPVLKEEPPRGALKPGYKVLVDNGRCPKGQIQEVSGGAGSRAGSSVGRTRRCVPRP